MAKKLSLTSAIAIRPALRLKLENLYEYYKPKRLVYLEYINRTKPKKPLTSRGWFMNLKELNLREADREWSRLRPETKIFYKDCATIDSKRYKYETSQWITNLMTINYDSDTVSLPDDNPVISQNDLRSLFVLQKGTPQLLVRPKRPPGPFAIFVREYAANRDIRGTEILKVSANLWVNLVDDERQRYKDMHQRLLNLHKQTLIDLSNRPDAGCDGFTELFHHDRRKRLSRPSHLIVPKCTESASDMLMDISDAFSNPDKKSSRNRKEGLLAVEKDDVHMKLEKVMSFIREADDYKKLKVRLGISRHRVDILKLFMEESSQRKI